MLSNFADATPTANPLPKMRPLRRSVIAQTVLMDEKTAGGLFVAPNARKTYDRARVIAVSAESDLGVQVGDLVVYERGVATPFKVDGIEFLRIADEYLLAVISPDQDADKAPESST